MASAREYLLNVVAQGFSRAVSMGAAFVAIVMFARIHGTELFGQLAFLMAFLMFAGVLAELGTTGALAKGLAEEKEKDPRTYLGNYILLRLVLAIVAVLVAIPAARLVRPDMMELLLITSLAIPFVGARVFETVFQIYGRPLYSVYSSAFLGLAQLFVALFLLLILRVELKGYMLGFVAVQFAYCLLTLALVFRLVIPRFSIDKKILLDIVLLAAPIGVWSIFNAVSIRADIFMLSYFRTADEVGIYNAAYRLLDLGTAVAATVAVPLVPVLTRKFAGNGRAMRTTAARVFELTVICTIPIPVSLMFIASPLVELIFGEAFSRSASLLPIFGWLFIMLVLMYVGNAINLSSNNIRHTAWSAVIAATLNILANLYLIPRYGVLGAAWSSAISTLFMLIVSMAFVRKSVGNVFELKKWMRIAAAALAPYIYLLLTPDNGIILRMVIAAVIYLLAIMLLRVLPIEYVSQLRNNSI